MILAPLILAGLVSAAAQPPTLCMDERCQPVSGERVALKDADRQFVWIAGDASRIVAGTLPAGAATLPLENDGNIVQSLVMITDDGVSTTADLALRCGDRKWNWSLPKARKHAMELVRPTEQCSLEIASVGYAAVANALAVRHGAVYLRRLPSISGVVLDGATGTAIAGAQILFPNGDTAAVTDARGEFKTFVDGEWPAWIKVDAAARARRTVLVPRPAADVRLPITLSPGGSILLKLEPPLGGEDLRWEARLVIDESAEEKVRTGAIAAGETSVTIGDLEAGPYRFVIMGEHPLQRVVVPVRVTDGLTVERSVHIEPTKLTLEVLRGGRPVPAAEVEILYEGGQWRVKLTVDEEGRAAEELWQRGNYVAAVRSWTDSREIGDDTSWTLDVPDRVIRGRVSDAATKTPVANALVTCDAGGSLTVERTKDDGSFTFRDVPHGTYTLTARSPGYEELKTAPVVLGEETETEVRDLLMKPVTGRTLRALSATGAPLFGALVFVSTRSGTRVAGIAAEDGRVVLPVSIEEAGAAFILPRSGSLGIARFASIAEAGDEELLVRVPDGSASLVVQTHTTTGDAIGGVSFILRINGILLPQSIKEAMNRHQGLPLSSDANGRLVLSRLPPGRYELWPLASREDLRAAASPSPPPAAVDVILTPGNHEAKMVFKPRS